jgi:predicted HTH domain antitoxin
MPKIGMDLPEDLVEAIKLPSEEVPMRLKRELAVRLYEKRLLGFGKARQLAEMTKWEFQRLLGEEGILRSYDVEELGKDLETIEELESE